MLFQAEQVRQFETLIASKQGIGMFELMKDAGTQVYFHARQKFPEAKRVAVLAGGGNNAGDAYIVAQHYQQQGVHIDVYAFTLVSQLVGDAKTAATHYQGRVIDATLTDVELAGYDIIIDGLLGTGLNRSVKANLLAVIHHVNAISTPVIAIDIPSGLNADTGCPMPVAIEAVITVTMVAIKAGMVTGQAKQFTGDILLADLGVGNHLYKETPPSAFWLEYTQLSPLPSRHVNTYKTHAGKLLCVGGNQFMPGAIQLTVTAGFRMGCGMVKVATHPAHQYYLTAKQPEVMLVDNQHLETAIKWADAVVLGPGLGLDEWGKARFDTVIHACEKYQKPAVIDADALTFLSQRSDLQLPFPVIITPHSGEAARLLNCSVADIENDRYSAVNQLKSLVGGCVVLKGPGTIIAASDCLWVNSHGGPAMASAGMGDVLSGMIGGLLAQGGDTETASLQGTVLHSKAADLRVEKNGQRGILASDLIEELQYLVNNRVE